MLSALEMIEEGLKNSDLKMVAAGYAKLAKSEEVGEDNDDQPSTRNRTCRREPHVKNSINLFVDDGKLFASDKKVDKKLLRGVRPTPRSRKSTKLVSVVCTRCNKKYNVHPSEAPITIGNDDSSSYVCTRCIHGKPGQ